MEMWNTIASRGYRLPRSASLGSDPGVKTRKGLILALGGLLVSATVFQRFGISFGTYSMTPALPATYVLLIIAAIGGTLALSVTRLAAFCLCLVAALASSIVNEDTFSPSSVVLLGVIYLPFVFILTPKSASSQEALVRCFLNISLFCALLGIGQFYAQFLVHGDWLFDFSARIPAFLRGPTGFNTVIPVGSLYKSNGFLFREPSGFSFMMALALLAEYGSYCRPVRLAAFGLALLLTYSGTGLLALLVGILIPFNRKTIVRISLMATVAIVVVLSLDGILNLSFTIGRLSEFGSERSSAYIRYIAPGRLLIDTSNTEAWTLVLGHGPGAISRKAAAYEFHDPTWAKLIYEYGIVGFGFFVALVLLTLRRSNTLVSLRAVLFVAWLVMGGHLLSPDQNVLTLALVGLLADHPSPWPQRAPSTRRPWVFGSPALPSPTALPGGQRA
jgi:hypothetical protein